MPKKSAPKKSNKRFSWATFFITVTLIINGILVNDELTWTGEFFSVPTLAFVTTALSLYFFIKEKNNGTLGKKFSWGSFFIAFTLSLNIGLALFFDLMFWQLVAVLTAGMALVSVLKEKKGK